jgi:hypothetical protein
MYGAIQLCTKHIAGFPASSELSPSPEQMEFCKNFLSKWNSTVIPFGGLLVRIAKYLLNGSPSEVKFQNNRHRGLAGRKNVDQEMSQTEDKHSTMPSALHCFVI